MLSTVYVIGDEGLPVSIADGNAVRKNWYEGRLAGTIAFHHL
jgi:hypothetical protein